ncbi:multidrug resistance-associated protein 1-like [Platysternon megacephalum]|uniref:Multidrug resistance-associated protein 1-like n=1 Tax=Platysternon megacephalum TaxID=55544 RepID=A0A4D9E3A0_9SAUR|nr:multidrug resistance-associated protein 1-like [Platysternon megacephalum]
MEPVWTAVGRVSTGEGWTGVRPLSDWASSWKGLASGGVVCKPYTQQLWRSHGSCDHWCTEPLRFHRGVGEGDKLNRGVVILGIISRFPWELAQRTVEYE